MVTTIRFIAAVVLVMATAATLCMDKIFDKQSTEQLARTRDIGKNSPTSRRTCRDPRGRSFRGDGKKMDRKDIHDHIEHEKNDFLKS